MMSRKYLREMMLQMVYVVVHEVVERGGTVFRHGAPRDAMKIVLRMNALAHLARRCRHHACELPVIELPEKHELLPWCGLILLPRDPIILRVPGKHEIV